jgi:hypothetical protein
LALGSLMTRANMRNLVWGMIAPALALTACSEGHSERVRARSSDVFLSAGQMAQAPITIEAAAKRRARTIARGHAPLGTGEKVLLPRSAIVRGDRGPEVIVATLPDSRGDVRFDRRSVELVDELDDAALVDGVEEGDRVVVEGALLVYELIRSTRPG